MDTSTHLTQDGASSFAIRVAQPDDVARTCEIRRRSIHEICAADYPDPAMREQWADLAPKNESMR